MRVADGLRSTCVRMAALICLCFLLGSTGWLSWLRTIMTFADPAQTDLFTMVLGYLAQAVGIGVAMHVIRCQDARTQSRVAVASLVAYAVLLAPATLLQVPAIALGCGYLMNVCCGVTQGYYLSCLASQVDANRRGTVFGMGYAVSTAATWLLSSMGDGVCASGLPCLATCVALAAACVLLVRATPSPAAALPEAKDAPARPDDAGATLPDDVDATLPDDETRALVLLACATVTLMSVVKNAGFAFPAADLTGLVDLELSRLYYGIGLVVAGYVADRNRRNALFCCAASLAVPFLMLSLSGAGATRIVLWAVGYLLFGFFTVFRVVLMTDLAADNGRIWLAGAGQLMGRVGDALGTLVCLALVGSPIGLIAVISALFVLTMWMVLVLYQHLYMSSETPAETSEPPIEPPVRDTIGEFCMAYGLSAREREVLPLLLDGKTNAEIAAELYVSQSTVKYHMRNIRKKTGCQTRLDVTDLYIRSLAQD